MKGVKGREDISVNRRLYVLTPIRSGASVVVVLVVVLVVTSETRRGKEEDGRAEIV